MAFEVKSVESASGEDHVIVELRRKCIDSCEANTPATLEWEHLKSLPTKHLPDLSMKGGAMDDGAYQIEETLRSESVRQRVEIYLM